MARFDCALWRPLPESGDQPRIRPTQVIFHTAVDAPGPTNLGGYFARADVALESHFWVPLVSPAEQLMDTEERADANLYANRRPDGTGAISIETEDEGDPVGVPWSDKQITDLVAIGVEAHRRHGIPVRICESPSDPGFGWHSMWGAPSVWTPSAGKTCPGSTRIGQIPRVMQLISEAITLAPLEDDMKPSIIYAPKRPTVLCEPVTQVWRLLKSNAEVDVLLKLGVPKVDGLSAAEFDLAKRLCAPAD